MQIRTSIGHARMKQSLSGPNVVPNPAFWSFSPEILSAFVDFAIFSITP